MGNISNYLETSLMNHAFKNTAYTPATHLYISLHTASPGETGSGAEVPSANNYARVTKDTWNAAASRSASNNGVITFNQASGSWGTVTDWGIWDSGTWGAGNLICYGSFLNPKVIVSGNVPTIASGDLSISVVSGGMSTYLANKLLDHFLKTAAYTQPTNIAVALHTADPTDAGNGAEVTNANNYSRTVCNIWNAAGATTGAVANTNAIDTAVASGSWGTVTHSSLFDSAVWGGGNMLWYGAMSPSQAVISNDFISFSSGDFSFTLD